MSGDVKCILFTFYLNKNDDEIEWKKKRLIADPAATRIFQFHQNPLSLFIQQLFLQMYFLRCDGNVLTVFNFFYMVEQQKCTSILAPSNDCFESVSEIATKKNEDEATNE